MMRGILAGAIVLAMTAVAIAQPPPPYYVRGDFNGWANSTDPMIDMGGGKWSYTIANPVPDPTEFKATVDDWSYNAPGSNAKWQADASGNINVNFFPNNVWSDGWMPDAKPRLGYTDHGFFDWEVVGDMNGWMGGAAWYLTDQGGGLHTAQIAMNAGTYQFKFRQQGSWAYSWGDDSGNSAANNSMTVASNGDLWEFEIDLPNGRWRAFLVPEPSSLALLALAGLLATRRR